MKSKRKCKTPFVLRQFRQGDEHSLNKNINDWEIYRYTSLIPHPYTMRHAREWIKRNIAISAKQNRPEINFALVIRGDVVGGIGLMKMRASKVEMHTAEIGYWLARRHWGKGVMTEAVRLVVDFGFRELGLRRIYASVFAPNKASARVLEKAGFKFEGINRKNYLKDGKVLDGLMYARVR